MVWRCNFAISVSQFLSFIPSSQFCIHEHNFWLSCNKKYSVWVCLVLYMNLDELKSWWLWSRLRHKEADSSQIPATQDKLEIIRICLLTAARIQKALWRLLPTLRAIEKKWKKTCTPWCPPSKGQRVEKEPVILGGERCYQHTTTY